MKTHGQTSIVKIRTNEVWEDNKSKEKAICDLCFVECQCLTTLKTHKLQQHQEGKNKLCMYCDYKNVIWDNLKAHIDANHDQHGEKKHLCDLCGKGFIFQASCKRHKLHNHQKKHCHICGKETFNKASLKDHLSSVHKIDVVTSVCKICGFTTNSRGIPSFSGLAKNFFGRSVEQQGFTK